VSGSNRSSSARRAGSTTAASALEFERRERTRSIVPDTIDSPMTVAPRMA
jgi:hypothetical protein